MKMDTVKLLSTFFGVGYLPYCPGTWASLTGIGIYLLLRSSAIIYLCITITILAIGFIVSAKAEKRFSRKDPSFIVIDEIAATLVLLYFIPRDLFCLFLAFLIFRGLDIAKAYPI